MDPRSAFDPRLALPPVAMDGRSVSRQVLSPLPVPPVARKGSRRRAAATALFAAGALAAGMGGWGAWGLYGSDLAYDFEQRSLREALALEVAKQGVTVNTISPGYIGTKMVTAIPQEILDSKILPQIPVNRLGKPEEIAGLVAYLASDEAAFVTGANISINGGQHMY